MLTFDVRTALQRQLDIEWRFATEFVLGQIDEDTALWSPAGAATYSVHRTDDGWSADWPDEGNDPPMVPTMGWILWHVEWWWTDTLLLVHGHGRVAPQDHVWSGTTDEIVRLKEKWDRVLADDDLERLVQWAMPDPQPLGLIASWLNFELAKNLAEINQLKMLRAALG
ncbi:DinB family protein [Ornithinimicrobium sp. LYQ92]|uniref:DinB family protein n=1 Tax=Serinicoccus sp. LYQ92 TaxID=3378798 RepID=UPI003852ECEC